MAEPLRILELCSSRRWIGEAAHVLHLCTGLSERGHEVTLIARRGWELEKRAVEAGLDVHSFYFESQFSPRHDGADRRNLRRLIAEKRPHLLHVHRSKEHWLAALTPRGNTPLVRSRHVVMRVKTGPHNRWLYRRTAKILCSSRTIEEGYRNSSLAPMVDGKLQTIHPGIEPVDLNADIDRDALRQQHFPNHAGVVMGLMVARYQPVKGHKVLLQAYQKRHLKDRDMCLLMVGKPLGPLKGEIDDILRFDEIEHTVRALEFVEAEELDRLYRAADFAIVASVGSEGWSRAALEAMNYGLPVVATTVGALPEIVVDGETGYLVPPDDANALGAALAAVAASPERRAEMGRAGRARLEQQFTRERWLDEMEAALRGLVAHP